MQSHRQKRVAIIGGGISGLALAIALKHMNKTYGTHWEPYIFDEKPSFGHERSFYILWKFGIKSLLELGLGKRLGAISWPILKLKSIDSASQEVLVDWPQDAKSPVDNESSEFSYLPPMYFQLILGLECERWI